MHDHLSRPRPSQVSVVIPAYNASDSLWATISSAIGAGVGEIVVVDDGSTDDTETVARRAGASVVLRTANRGSAAARQTGIDAAQLDFLILCDADDLLLSEGVLNGLELISRHPEASGVCGASVVVRGTKTIGAIRPWAPTIGPGDLVSKMRSFGPPACAIWRTSSVRSAYAAEPSQLAPAYAEDYEFYIRMSCQAPILSHQAEVCIYNSGLGKSFKSPKRDSDETARVARYYASYLGLPAPVWTPARRMARSLTRQSFYTSSRVKRVALLLLAACLAPQLAIKSATTKLPWVGRLP